LPNDSHDILHTGGVEGIWGKLVIGSNRCDNRGQ